MSHRGRRGCTHIAFDDVGQDADRVVAAEGALQVGEFRQHDRGLRIAQPRAVLRDAGQHLAHVGDPCHGRAAAGVGLLLAALADEHERDDDDRADAEHPTELRQLPAAPVAARASELEGLALGACPGLLHLAGAHVVACRRPSTPPQRSSPSRRRPASVRAFITSRRADGMRSPRTQRRAAPQARAHARASPGRRRHRRPRPRRQAPARRTGRRRRRYRPPSPPAFSRGADFATVVTDAGCSLASEPIQRTIAPSR